MCVRIGWAPKRRTFRLLVSGWTAFTILWRMMERHVARVMMRVAKGALVPADDVARAALRKMGLGLGDLVSVEARKPRNPRFWRLVHAGFARLLIQNLEDFEGLTEHDALKKVQVDGDIECEHERLELGETVVIVKRPKSLAFASMDETTFRDVYGRMCEYVARTYWPDLDAEKVNKMACEMEAME